MWLLLDSLLTQARHLFFLGLGFTARRSGARIVITVGHELTGARSRVRLTESSRWLGMSLVRAKSGFQSNPEEE